MMNMCAYCRIVYTVGGGDYQPVTAAKSAVYSCGQCVISCLDKDTADATFKI